MVLGQSYHDSATGTVTDYLSTVELVRRELCRHPVGALIDVTVRSLADAIGRGRRAWGAITPALKRLEREGHIVRLVTPKGTLVEVRRSDHIADRMFDASGCDQDSDRPPAVPATPIMASGPHEPALVGDQHADRMFDASGCDQDSDRSPLYGTDPGWIQQQQQQDARACEGNQDDQEPAAPATLTKSEWSQIRAAAPVYTESDLHRDLAKLATRAGIAYPIGVIISALRSGEPIYSRQELEARAAAMAPPVPESALDDRSAPTRPERRSRSRPPAERHIEAAPVSEKDLDQAAGGLWPYVLSGSSYNKTI